MRKLIIFALVVAVGFFAVSAEAGKYLVVGSTDAGAEKGLIVELGVDGTSVAGTMSTPVGPPNSTFPMYNPGNGILLYGASRPATVGVFDFADYVANGTTTVSLWPENVTGYPDSEAAPDPNSGKFLVTMRNGTMSTLDPTNGNWTDGATHGSGIPETTFIYGGNVYTIGEAGNVWITPLLGDGTTAGAMVNLFNTSGTVGIPHDTGGYSEYVTAVVASDGTCYLTNLSPNVYEFDLTNPVGGVTNSVDLTTTVFTTADRVTGVQLDEAAGLLYVVGQESVGTEDFVGVIDISSPVWTVTKILREADGDTIVSGSSRGLAFVDLGEVIPEPAGLGLIGVALLGLRRRRS